ncbi:hypothetical protein AQUCO_00300617v1 [Aquilegia coerulea]|uniref:Exonuclease domain-containing protein n=1 Tax=Aquilegia coerulea TaxID=218851 RepID=A0A2G5EZM5_AQUCA|nr:hypothetical protein AQUCO_00300617v1 [Aquilegia coerulea]PIA61204.1 hypothetical protein AQUCO_00300617v1 [Aquilegia coerulea]PIA61205.1 hypothetical protein AQUCO_00300617v1 [Aquilegia coerulea]
MRSCMCFSALQNPRFRMRLINGSPILHPISYASIWLDNIRNIRSSLGRSSLKFVGSDTNRPSRDGLEPRLRVGDAKKLPGRLKQQQITSKVYVRKNHIQSSQPGVVRHDELLDGVVTDSNKIHIYKPDFCDTSAKTSCREIQRLVTIIVFDIETTGLSRELERIIEIALRDLNGGENSTFQTLVNPERYVSNHYLHGITTNMVSGPSVPRFKDLLPILLDYVQSRHIPNTPILFVSHNARTFDVPFLINEFSRCSEEIPSDWRFLDTLSLARDLAKSEGGKDLPGKSLQTLRQYMEIPLEGEAHRAMADVNTLSRVLQELTQRLKLPVSSLVERSFTALDIVNSKKKKKSTS